MKTSSLSALTAAAVSAILLGATLSATAQTPPAGLQNIQRLRPPGPATIDCVNLHDSHCNTRITGSASPTCVVQVGATTLNLGPGGTPVSTTVTAACTPHATEYAWQATAGQSPSGKSSSISFAAAGNYCFTVAGRNQAIYRDYGAPSPQLCITVNDAAPAGCAPQAPYTSYLSCPAGQSGQIARYFTYDTQTCSWSYSDMNGCVAQPICDPSQYQEQPQACPAGQSGTIISRSYLQCPGNTYGPWMTYSSSCVPAVPVCPLGQVWNPAINQCQPQGPQQVTVVLDEYATSWFLWRNKPWYEGEFGPYYPVCGIWKSTVSCTWDGATLSCPLGGQSTAASISAAAKSLWPGPAPTIEEGKICAEVSVFNSWY